MLGAMAKTSAGILMYRWSDGIQVLLVHPGGPFWARRDEGAWSIPKGEYDPGSEAPLDAARREFEEELGLPVPDSDAVDLGAVEQKGGKVVRAFALEGDLDVDAVVSNTFSMEWPPRSGTLTDFPEVDRAEWMTIERARVAINVAQSALLDRLLGGVAEP
jgi:predicted NUDIX family NTP pyrophosphohydrolase